MSKPTRISELERDLATARMLIVAANARADKAEDLISILYVIRDDLCELAEECDSQGFSWPADLRVRVDMALDMGSE